ncbi:response regulator transcription factor [Streptomyces sp. NPDC059452]|uniref:response regulator transcription factor n=1 Tax=Streptomyces sp. NPDC059452 TaxID=3346835 RepID=UPI0036A1EA8B
MSPSGSPHLSASSAAGPPSLAAALALAGTLSAREAEVFSLLADAPSYEVMAEQLGISRRTVRFHVERIRSKLGNLQYHQLCAASYLHALAAAPRPAQ